MIDYAVREALGPYGRVLLDFWLDHAIIISSIVLVYGVIVVRAQHNLQLLAQKTYELLGKEDFLAQAELEKILKVQELTFWDTLRSSSRFPFITLPFSLIIYRISQANMNKLLCRYFVYQQRAKQSKNARRTHVTKI
jgi:hypothetical protein